MFLAFKRKKHKLFILAQQAHLILSLLVLTRFQTINRVSYWAVKHPRPQSATDCILPRPHPDLPEGCITHLCHPSSWEMTQKSCHRMEAQPFWVSSLDGGGNFLLCHSGQGYLDIKMPRDVIYTNEAKVSLGCVLPRWRIRKWAWNSDAILSPLGGNTLTDNKEYDQHRQRVLQKAARLFRHSKAQILYCCPPSPALFSLLFQSSYVLPGATLFDLWLQKQTKPFKPNVKGYEEEWRVSEACACKSEMWAFTPKEAFKSNMTSGKINLLLPFLL